MGHVESYTERVSRTLIWAFRALSGVASTPISVAAVDSGSRSERGAS